MSHTQDGIASPNPDYPQEVKVVTGDNTIDIVGKNLFDKNHANIIDNCVTGSSQTLDNVAGCKTLYISCKPNTTYTISKIASTRFIVVTTNAIPAIGVSTSTRSIDLTGTHITITTGANANYICVFYYYSESDTLTEQQILDSIMIEQGSTASTYEAYTSDSYPINLEGKNKFDFDKFKSENSTASITGTYNAFTCSGTSVTTYYNYDFKPSTQYYISGSWSTTYGNFRVRIIYTDNDSTVIAQNYTMGTATGTIGQYTPVGYTIKNIEVTTWTSANITINNLQVEEGTTGSTFEKYWRIDLAKIGTYKDKIYKDSGKWYLHKEIGKVTLNGTENITLNGQSSNYTRFDVIINGIINGTAETFTLIQSDHYTAKYALEPGNIFNSTGVNLVSLIHNSVITLDNFKTWLSNNKPVVYYPLATPTTTEITDTNLISQLEAVKLLSGTQNNFSIDADTLPTLNLNYISEANPHL